MAPGKPGVETDEPSGGADDADADPDQPEAQRPRPLRLGPDRLHFDGDVLHLRHLVFQSAEVMLDIAKPVQLFIQTEMDSGPAVGRG